MDQLIPVRDGSDVSVTVVPPAANRMRRIIVAGLVATMVMIAALAVSQAIDFRFFNLRIWAFNADKHYSVFGLASLLAQAAVAAASIWRAAKVDRHRWAWLTLGVLAAVLVLIRGLTSFNATVLALPLAVVFLLLCWLTWRDPAPARTVVWAGLILMAISLVLHKVGLDADSSLASDYTWAYQILGIVKHGAELGGWMLLATGIVAGNEGRIARKVAPAYVRPLAAEHRYG